MGGTVSVTSDTPDNEQTDEVLRETYHHLRWVRDEQSEFYRSYQQKIQRLMTLNIVLVAGMSYGLTQLDWSEGGVAYQSAIAFTGVGAATALFLGVFGCVQCIGIQDVSVLGVRRLVQVIRGREAARLRPAGLYKGLSRNIEKAIRVDRLRLRRYRGWGSVINRATTAGLVFVAFFIAITTIGNLYLAQ